MIVWARAPLRISFAGGGTDISPFPETEGGAVLSTTISRYVTSAMTRKSSVAGQPAPDRARRMLRVAFRHFGLPEASLSETGLRFHSDAPLGSGLGASSAIAVTLVGLLAECHELILSPAEIAEHAFQIERDSGIKSGRQDQYAAAFGGFNFIQFGRRVEVDALRVPERIRRDLESRILLCYTGATRQSSRIIVDQSARVRSGNRVSLAGLRAQKAIAGAMRKALLDGELDTFGELLQESWTEKKKLSPLITTESIEVAHRLACAHGAIGGKVTGAGGGGHMFFYCQAARRGDVARALRRAGVQAAGFRFESAGMTTWRT